MSDVNDMSEQPPEVEPFVFSAPLSVCVDVKHPQAYLALGPVKALADELAVAVDWLPFAAPAMKPPPEPGPDRGSRHRHARARYQELDLQRYAEVQGLTIREPYRSPDSSLPLLALSWLRERAPGRTFELLQRVFAGYWTRTLDIEDAGAIGAIVADLGEDPAAFTAFVRSGGPESLASLRRALVAAGVFTVPSLVVENEVFVGRAHLPMVRWLLTGRSGPPPV